MLLSSFGVSNAGGVKPLVSSCRFHKFIGGKFRQHCRRKQSSECLNSRCSLAKAMRMFYAVSLEVLQDPGRLWDLNQEMQTVLLEVYRRVFVYIKAEF